MLESNTLGKVSELLFMIPSLTSFSQTFQLRTIAEVLASVTQEGRSPPLSEIPAAGLVDRGDAALWSRSGPRHCNSAELRQALCRVLSDLRPESVPWTLR